MFHHMDSPVKTTTRIPSSLSFSSKIPRSTAVLWALDLSNQLTARRSPLIVKLPIVSRPLGGYIGINVRGYRAQNLAFDHPRIKGDETHNMRFRCRNDFLFSGIVAGFCSPSCYESENEQHIDKL